MSNTSAQLRRYTVAVAGNPNCGKTTVFNGLTGARQQIGNWPGVTVEKKEGRFSGHPVARILAEPFSGLEEEAPATVHTGEVWDRTTAHHHHVEFRVVDLPGIYSLSATSEDEIVARDYLVGGEPDLIVDVVDASNIERNLYLTMQLAELGIPVVVVLTMTDIAAKKSIAVDVARLRRMLGAPVIAINALERRDVERLKADLIEIAHGGLGKVEPIPAPRYPDELESAIDEVAAGIVEDDRNRARWRAIRALEGDRSAADGATVSRLVASAGRRAEEELGEEPDIVFADARYQLIQRIASECVRRGTLRDTLTERIDRLVIHRYLGIPVFLVAMFVVFWFTISVGGAFIDFFDILAGGVFVDGVGALLDRAGAPRWLTVAIAEGVGGGLQTVATFVPVIFAMFFALAVLEDSGYMARAAFVMDRLMRAIGLPGKSFVPMLLGFGCTIPAVMATKTLDSRRDRLMTIFMTPLMSCGARLPVYALVATAVFRGRAGLVVFSIYVIGIVLAVATGLLMKRTLFRGTASHFILELPPYHAPRLGQIFGASSRRLFSFLHRAGTTIVLMVGILGLINAVTFGEDGVRLGGDPNRSLLAHVGRAVTPAFGPMGIESDNWPATVAIFAGLFAKEAAVGTLNSIYLQQAAGPSGGEPAGAPGASGGPASERRAEGAFGLLAIVREALSTIPRGLASAVGLEAGHAEGLTEEARTFPVMRARFSRAGAYAFLLFVLIYFPCVSALGVVIREAGHFYGWLLAAYLTVSAWAAATIVYQSFGPGRLVWVVVASGVLLVEIAGLRWLGRRSA
ncbi:MAG: ferrous iron transport protein B [Spirochaetota bacterium]